jgi:heme-degrading monooxygenase HmoA
MIARVWKGATRQADADRYFDYLKQTGLKDYAAIEGNQGVFVLRREGEDRAEFVLISLWESFDAIRRFAGEDLDRAVYYPADSKFLLSLEPAVLHYEVLASPTTAQDVPASDS